LVQNSAGAAYKDGRLRPGDQILEVMKEDLRNVTHSFALHALRQTPNKVRYLQLYAFCSAFFPVLWNRIRVEPDPNGSTTDCGRKDPVSHWEFSSGSRRGKMTLKKK
jgi:hypothetical protein